MQSRTLQINTANKLYKSGEKIIVRVDLYGMPVDTFLYRRVRDSAKDHNCEWTDNWFYHTPPAPKKTKSKTKRLATQTTQQESENAHTTE